MLTQHPATKNSSCPLANAPGPQNFSSRAHWAGGKKFKLSFAISALHFRAPKNFPCYRLQNPGNPRLRRTHNRRNRRLISRLFFACYFLFFSLRRGARADSKRTSAMLALRRGACERRIQNRSAGVLTRSCGSFAALQFQPLHGADGQSILQLHTRHSVRTPIARSRFSSQSVGPLLERSTRNRRPTRCRFLRNFCRSEISMRFNRLMPRSRAIWPCQFPYIRPWNNTRNHLCFRPRAQRAEKPKRVFARQHVDIPGDIPFRNRRPNSRRAVGGSPVKQARKQGNLCVRRTRKKLCVRIRWAHANARSAGQVLGVGAGEEQAKTLLLRL